MAIGGSGFSETDGSYNQSSDRSVKTEIEQVPTVLSKVNQLNPVHYKYVEHIDAERKSWGFIAQEVEALFSRLRFRKKWHKGFSI